jgi:signal transduction histidine kinase
MSESRPRFWERLTGKAFLLLVAILLLGVAEIGMAVYFRAEIERDFSYERSIDQIEGRYVVAISQVLGVLDSVGLRSVSPGSEGVRVALGLWRDQLARLKPAIDDLLRLRVSPAEAPRIEDVAVRVEGLLARLIISDDDMRALAGDVHETLIYHSNLLHERLGAIKEEKSNLSARHAAKRNRYAFIMAALGFGGFLLIVASGGFFLVRLTQTLEKLRGRASEITEGRYGTPLDVNRRDELGQLVQSVNAMASSLSDRERQIEDLRLRFSYQEKMLALGTFASGMAHEIGNPIQAILAISSQVSESLLEDQSKQNVQLNADRIGLIAVQAERLAKTVSEIREFMRQGAAQTELVDANEVVNTTVRLMRFDPRFANLELTLDLSPDLPAVQAVADHLAQVVMNLLINAADAVELGKGRITVSTRAVDGGGIDIAVADNGCGMTEDVRRHALDAFFTTKPKGRGTGLGLAICQTIVEEHGGRLMIDSLPGEGTCVTIRIHGT